MTVRLAIDTATDLGCVALTMPDGASHEVHIPDRRHAALLLPETESMLATLGVEWSDLQEIVVANGPGSFTGLRIGFATVRGVLAVHPHIDLATVLSLMGTAFAAREREGDTVAALYNALRGEVFAAVYRFPAGPPEVLVPPRLIAASALETLPRPQLVAGDGVSTYRDEVQAWIGAAPQVSGGASAKALLELSGIGGVATRIANPDEWDPTYGRRAAAQDRWEAQHGRPLPDPSGD